MRILTGLLALVAWHCAHAQAAPPASTPADDRAAARDHYQKGTKAYDLGRWDDAIKEYEAAYELKDDPVLLYNIGQAHRLAGHAPQAVHFYKSYLRRSPKAQNREEVEGRIAELQKLIEASGKPPDQTLPVTPSPPETAPPPSATPPTPPPPTTTPATVPPATPPPPMTTTETAPPIVTTTPPPPSEHPGRSLKIAGFTLVGVGGLALIGGIACSALAIGASNTVADEAKNHQTFDPSVQSAGKAASFTAGALYAVGGAAVITGAVLAAVGYKRARAARMSMLTPFVGPGVGGLAFSTRLP